ncbi:MAG: hypothetical protein IJV52_02100, partial [Prevotella sp.]|nr:hypothetical protein [Prevotella sp.]
KIIFCKNKEKLRNPQIFTRFFQLGDGLDSGLSGMDQSGTELKWSVQSSESYCCAIKTIKKEEI